MELFLLILRLFLAGILALAGIGKLLDLPGGKKVMKDFGLPEDLAIPAAVALSLVEIVLAAALLFSTVSWLAAAGALLLMLIFIGGMLWQIAKGRSPDCHCFGQLHSEPVSLKSVVRNILFAIPALILLSAGPSFQGYSLSDPAINSAQNVLGLISIVMFAAVLFYLRRISKQQDLVLRRIELLEVLSLEGGSVERKDAGAPQDSLPIGALFPDFTLPDLAGRNLSLADLMVGKPLLFVFVNTTCEPCAVLLPELEDWERELRDKVDFVYVSRGNADDNAEKFGHYKRILIQKDRELGDLVFARWTPSALFVTQDGRIGSHVAAGDASIRKLVEDIMKNNLKGDLTHFPLSNGDRIPRKIGETIPEFDLEDISGRRFTDRSFKEKRTLVTFWSPSCPHCHSVMEELKVWDREGYPEDLDVVIFSDGDLETHRELGLRAPIILDKDYKVAGKLGAFGTPSAVLVDDQGRFISETAIGGPNIWSLVRRAKVDG